MPVSPPILLPPTLTWPAGSGPQALAASRFAVTEERLRTNANQLCPVSEDTWTQPRHRRSAGIALLTLLLDTVHSPELG